MAECAVYILAFSNEKIYVGISKDPEKRLKSGHRLGKIGPVPRAIKKHGLPRLFRIATGSRAECYELEEYLVDTLDTLSPKGYNLVGGGLGSTDMSEESRQRMSTSLKEVWRGRKEGGYSEKDLEAFKMVGLTHKGKVITEETRKRMSASQLGRVFSSEARSKMSAAAKKKKPMSDETRARMSAAAKNKPLVSEDTRKRKSAAGKLRWAKQRLLQKAEVT